MHVQIIVIYLWRVPDSVIKITYSCISVSQPLLPPPGPTDPSPGSQSLPSPLTPQAHPTPCLLTMMPGKASPAEAPLPWAEAQSWSQGRVGGGLKPHQPGERWNPEPPSWRLAGEGAEAWSPLPEPRGGWRPPLESCSWRGKEERGCPLLEHLDTAGRGFCLTPPPSLPRRLSWPQENTLVTACGHIWKTLYFYIYSTTLKRCKNILHLCVLVHLV